MLYQAWTGAPLSVQNIYQSFPITDVQTISDLNTSTICNAYMQLNRNVLTCRRLLIPQVILDISCSRRNTISPGEGARDIQDHLEKEQGIYKITCTANPIGFI
jgi:hypothetical protein